jgi:ATP-dependent protease HslVU (ClpYQ) peptidase subunit
VTCIVGIVENGKVTIGGDSAGVAGYVVTIRSDPKVFRVGSFLIGFTSSFRMGQLLRYTFHAPELPEGMDVFDYMVKMFAENARECLKTGGYAKKESEQESGGNFLVGYAGRLFSVDSDYQIAESACGYMAIGSGSEVALGALFATQGQPVRGRIQTALTAAEQFTAYVRRPFIIEEM